VTSLAIHPDFCLQLIVIEAATRVPGFGSMTHTAISRNIRVQGVGRWLMALHAGLRNAIGQQGMVECQTVYSNGSLMIRMTGNTCGGGKIVMKEHRLIAGFQGSINTNFVALVANHAFLVGQATKSFVTGKAIGADVAVASKHIAGAQHGVRVMQTEQGIYHK